MLFLAKFQRYCKWHNRPFQYHATDVNISKLSKCQLHANKWSVLHFNEGKKAFRLCVLIIINLSSSFVIWLIPSHCISSFIFPFFLFVARLFNPFTSIWFMILNWSLQKREKERKKIVLLFFILFHFHFAIPKLFIDFVCFSLVSSLLRLF